MTDKNNIPKFFHRLRKADQKIIKVGFLFSDFSISNNSSSLISPYFEIKNEKISKTVFSINEVDIISDELKEKIDEWVSLSAENPFKVAQNIYDKKIDVLIVLSDNKFIKEVLNYRASPLQIAGVNTHTLKNSYLDNKLISKLSSNLKNIKKPSLLMNKKNFAKNIEAIIFTSFDYLISLKNNIPSVEELKVLWELANETGRQLNENEFAIIERILLIRPKAPEILNPLAFLLSYYNEENIHSVLEFFPDETLAKNFLILQLAYKEKNWNIAEEVSSKILNIEPKTSQEQCIFSQSLYRMGCVYEDMGRLNDAISEFLECVDKTPDSDLEVKSQAYSNYLFLLHYTDMSPKEIFEKSKEYANLFKNITKYSHHKITKEKIRVGYLSPDFRQHVVAFFAFVFFTAKNHERFETYAYMLNAEDAYTNLFKKSADCYRNLKGIKSDKAAQIIYDDDIDILFDLSGHAGSGLPILARKPAPIQICGIGYFSTTGLPEVDYFLVDKYMAPETEDALFTEKLIRLPHSHFCYTNIIPPTERTNSFEKNNFITFGSMNNAHKMNSKVWYTWAKILERVPNSKLFLKSNYYADPVRLNKEKEQMKKYNVDPERVIFEPASLDYLKKYNNIDIALDTFPYPGGGTTCDALLMSVPVVTLSGNSCHERFGKSILCNIGLDELVANSIGEYIDIAVNLANDKMRIKKYHDEIYRLMENSAIMNQYLYIQDLEAAYEKIYEEWLNNE